MNDKKSNPLMEVLSFASKEKTKLIITAMLHQLPYAFLRIHAITCPSVSLLIFKTVV